MFFVFFWIICKMQQQTDFLNAYEIFPEDICSDTAITVKWLSILIFLWHFIKPPNLRHFFWNVSGVMSLIKFWSLFRQSRSGDCLIWSPILLLFYFCNSWLNHVKSSYSWVHQCYWFLLCLIRFKRSKLYLFIFNPTIQLFSYSAIQLFSLALHEMRKRQINIVQVVNVWLMSFSYFMTNKKYSHVQTAFDLYS